MNRGRASDYIFMDYKKCYGFEANPELFQFLKKKYRFCKNVEIIHGALSNLGEDTITFYVTNNDSASSLVGQLKNEVFGHRIFTQSKIQVPAIHLNDFLKQRKINFIDTYISDIQGMDLEVLKTIKLYIDEKKIETITCETSKDKYSNLYKDLPDNSETGFFNLLNKNYKMVVAKGWGLLQIGKFEEVPESYWEMDCMWKLKKQKS